MMLDKILNFLKKVYISLNELELLFTGKTSCLMVIMVLFIRK